MLGVAVRTTASLPLGHIAAIYAFQFCEGRRGCAGRVSLEANSSCAKSMRRPMAGRASARMKQDLTSGAGE
jgi:hypothetical protein